MTHEGFRAFLEAQQERRDLHADMSTDNARMEPWTVFAVGEWPPPCTCPICDPTRYRDDYLQAFHRAQGSIT
jgi:hypothetical protein